VRGEANPANDEGPVDPNVVLSDLTFVLRPSEAQQTDLEQFLAKQQDPSSDLYHHWLTPDEYAQRFGASPEDVQRITDWLRAQNLEVTNVARARNSIQARGTARAVEQTFGTEIRNYRVRGRRHFANANNPTIPADLNLMVAAIEGLDDFRLEPRSVLLAQASLEPNYTAASGRHNLAPDDLANIYNVKPLYAAGLDGTGQTIVVAGQTQLDLADVRTFRARFGLSAVDPEMILVPNSSSPGVSSDDVGEANLDLQWVGAVARNARILFVYSRSVMDAVRYSIDQNLAPVISVSYGLCELSNSASSLRAYQTWARQANAQGITWVNAAGDSGGADCVRGSSGIGALAVDAPASVPEVTAIGGTTLTESSSAYWSATNATNQGSALSYIPEAVWNDSTTGSPAAGGGGASAFFLKPLWQTGAGMPNDGARSVPDISLAASANLNGYLVYSGGKLAVFGGTSAGTPAFAGMLALLNQQLTRTGQGSPGVGNINPRLYSLAQSVPAAFHDVTRGDNVVTVTCTVTSRNCSAGSYGYSAAAGYDLASGLGSVDAYALVTNWTSATGSAARKTTSVTLSGTTQVTLGQTVVLTASLSSIEGSLPSGTVSFKTGSIAIGTATVSNAKATITVGGAYLRSGSNVVTAEYSGDAGYEPATGSIVIEVAALQSGPATLSGIANAASFRTAFAPGMLLSVFGSGLAPSVWNADRVPLPTQVGGISVTINGIAAPLLYVSPAQLNIQVPYEITVGSQATISVNNNGSVATTSFTPAFAAPGIFTDQSFAPVPNSGGTRGQALTLFITGAGSLNAPVATGGAPAGGTAASQLPRPTQPVAVTVGGVNAPVLFAGVPAGLVGVLQVNYQIPAGVPSGELPIVVSIGDVSSVPARLTVLP
jgi:uncharacterized protein (TIGR03437 family)